MKPAEYCRDLASPPGSSSHYSLLFLSAPARDAVNAVRAFFREINSIAEECGEASLGHTKFHWWREELAGIYSGKAQHPVGRAMIDAIGAFSLPESEMREIIDGTEQKFGTFCYPDFDTMQNICGQPSAALARIEARIYGFDNPATLEYADRLGRALQLIHIIRNVGKEARNGRCALPLDELERFDVPVQDILSYRQSVAFESLMRFQGDRAENFCQRALASLPAEDQHRQLPGRILLVLYRALLSEIVRERFSVLDRRTSLTPLRKFWLAWRTRMKNTA